MIPPVPPTYQLCAVNHRPVEQFATNLRELLQQMQAAVGVATVERLVDQPQQCQVEYASNMQALHADTRIRNAPLRMAGWIVIKQREGNRLTLEIRNRAVWQHLTLAPSALASHLHEVQTLGQQAASDRLGELWTQAVTATQPQEASV